MGVLSAERATPNLTCTHTLTLSEEIKKEQGVEKQAQNLLKLYTFSFCIYYNTFVFY